MHHMEGPKGTEFNFNGGFDSDIYIIVRAEMLHTDLRGPNYLRVPADDLIALVAHHVRSRRIGALEDMDDADVLGIPQDPD